MSRRSPKPLERRESAVEILDGIRILLPKPRSLLSGPALACDGRVSRVAPVPAGYSLPRSGIRVRTSFETTSSSGSPAISRSRWRWSRQARSPQPSAEGLPHRNVIRQALAVGETVAPVVTKLDLKPHDALRRARTACTAPWTKKRSGPSSTRRANLPIAPRLSSRRRSTRAPPTTSPSSGPAGTAEGRVTSESAVGRQGLSPATLHTATGDVHAIREVRPENSAGPYVADFDWDPSAAVVFGASAPT